MRRPTALQDAINKKTEGFSAKNSSWLLTINSPARPPACSHRLRSSLSSSNSPSSAHISLPCRDRHVSIMIRSPPRGPLLLTAALLLLASVPSSLADASVNSPSKKPNSPPSHTPVGKPPSSVAFRLIGNVHPAGYKNQTPSQIIFFSFQEHLNFGLQLVGEIWINFREYYVEMRIGDPPMPYYLDMDTGSDVTWIQCDPPEAPCVKCFKVRRTLQLKRWSMVDGRKTEYLVGIWNFRGRIRIIGPRRRVLFRATILCARRWRTRRGKVAVGNNASLRVDATTR